MTVSYTCQKPIKFWAKCKINLLYKLNQPFCVFQAALSSWQQGSGLGPHSSCPWSSPSLFIHKTIPSSVSILSYLLVTIWSALPKAIMQVNGFISEVPGSLSPCHCLCVSSPPPSRNNLLRTSLVFLVSSPFLLPWLRECPIPFRTLSIHMLLTILVPQFPCQ